jgi:hypothetical protein
LTAQVHGRCLTSQSKEAITSKYQLDSVAEREHLFLKASPVHYAKKTTAINIHLRRPLPKGNDGLTETAKKRIHEGIGV